MLSLTLVTDEASAAAAAAAAVACKWRLGKHLCW